MTLEPRIVAAEKRLDAVEGRVSSIEGRLDENEAEVLRSRQRLHRLEATERALTLAAESVQMLAERSTRALDNIEHIAESAAQKAIGKDRVNRANAHRKRLAFWAAVSGGIGGGIYAIFEVAHGLFG